MKKLLVYISFILLALSSCIVESAECDRVGTTTIDIHIFNDNAGTKAVPYAIENGISDLSLFIYDNEGNLVYSTYMSEFQEMISVEVQYNHNYYIYAVANVGDLTENTECATRSQIEELYRDFVNYNYIVNDDEYLHLSAKKEIFVSEEVNTVPLPLKRMVCKFTIIVDKSQLSSDVSRFNVRVVRVENYNRRVYYFKESKLEESAFNYYHFRYMANDTPIYTTGEIFYITENMHGNLLSGNTSEVTHRPPSGYRNLCTMIEIAVSYKNSEFTNSQLLYRFYLHDGLNLDNFDVKRNTEYKCTLIPVGEGIEYSWRVDNSSMEYL